MDVAEEADEVDVVELEDAELWLDVPAAFFSELFVEDVAQPATKTTARRQAPRKGPIRRSERGDIAPHRTQHKRMR